MSEYLIKIFPNDEKKVPNLEERTELLALLKGIVPTGSINEKVLNEVTFIDQGFNFESITCNICNDDIDLSNWSEWIDEAGNEKYSNLTILTPCCNTHTSLNDLVYKWPAGFASYVVEFSNPDEENVVKIERLITPTHFKLVRAHY